MIDPRGTVVFADFGDPSVYDNTGGCSVRFDLGEVEIVRVVYRGGGIEFQYFRVDGTSIGVSVEVDKVLLALGFG